MTFGVGAWSSLTEKNFDLHVTNFDDSFRGDAGPWFGCFSNALPGYPKTLSLKRLAHPHNDGQRPLLDRGPSKHPLAVRRLDGIIFDEILDFYAASGHDMRPAPCD
jgi:hypothetical protein